VRCIGFLTRGEGVVVRIRSVIRESLVYNVWPTLVDEFEGLGHKRISGVRHEQVDCVTDDGLEVEPWSSEGIELARVGREVESLDDEERLERNGSCRD
jgi:hypothetical protein